MFSRKSVKNLYRYILPICIGSLMSSASFACPQKDQAKSEFEFAQAAAKAGSHGVAVSYFKNVMELCPPTFMVHYRYGDSLYALGKHTEARIQYQAAQQLNVPDHVYARALAKEARIDAADGNLMLAARKLKDAKLLGKDGWIKQLASNVNKGLAEMEISTDEILRSINAPTRMVGEPTSIDIHIHFDFNSEQLNDTGRFEVMQLIRALQDESLEESSFIIVGHADAQGIADYNLNLSKQRADSVLANITAADASLAERIKTEAKGDSDPLCDGNDEDAYRCNRRVELIVSGASNE